MAVKRVKAGDTKPLEAVLAVDGIPEDLGGGAAVRLALRPALISIGAGAAEYRAPGVDLTADADIAQGVDLLTGRIVDKGLVRWTPPAGFTPGIYDVEWVADFPGGERVTYPADGYERIEVLPSLVTVPPTLTLRTLTAQRSRAVGPLGDVRLFPVSRFIEGALDFFGVERWIAVGAFYGHASDELLTVDDARIIVEDYLDQPLPPPPTPGPTPQPGRFLGPIETVAEIDAKLTGNRRGDAHLVMEDFTIRAWDDSLSSWRVISGGGAPTPTPSTAPINLFVQATQPLLAALLHDSLWIPTNPDGTSQPVSAWAVLTGLGDGDGGNLFIQPTAPSPTVDALWIPTNPDGSAKWVTEWVVLTGRGSVVGVGNPNLVISSSLPANPLPGTFYIPLNADQTAKSPDLWRVYA